MNICAVMTVLLVTGASMDLPLDSPMHNVPSGEEHRLSLLFCWRFTQGWLQHADPESGLIPRNISKDAYWNAKDAAADNYPFMVLSSLFTDRALFDGRMHDMLETEQRLTNRVGVLPDDYVFATNDFRTPKPRMEDLIFGASEYAKDGLLPMTELMGPSPWADRMLELLDAILEHGEAETEAGLLPSTSHEVAGELMQTLSRAYWMTGKEAYKDVALRTAAYFIEHHPLDRQDRFSFDDHGCEVLSGLTEAYLIAAEEEPELHAKWKPLLHATMDRLLEVGRDEDGFFYMHVNPKTGEVLRDELTDNWGYNYNGYATVAMIDDVERYHEAIRFALGNLDKPRLMDYPWEGGGGDGNADSLESGLNLLNRYRIPAADAWAHHTAKRLRALQRDTGIIEGWHGDGNTARTLIMYAMMQSEGCYLHPWRADLRLGAHHTSEGQLHIRIRADWPWEGTLHFDVPRHKVYWNMPFDYPRLNQFPEWFTVSDEDTYEVLRGDDKESLTGKELLMGLPVKLPQGEQVLMTVVPSHGK